MNTQEWAPGDPLHPVVGGVTRPMFEVLGPGDGEEDWSRCATWPKPLGRHRLEMDCA